MLTLIQNGEVYAPEYKGRQDVLLINDKVAKIGEVNRRAVEALGIGLDVIDATGRLITPRLLDPHEHLTGGSGEKGFSTRTPEIYLHEIIAAGITTVVGCLGVDTTTKTMAGLLARAKGLREEGLTAFIYSGGYNVPPTTITGSIRDDILFITEVIGAGEIAISDLRATEPAAGELARLVSDAYVGGLLSGKAGVTHLHVGNGKGRLSVLRTLLDEYDVEPSWLYPTHVERNQALMEEAVALTRRGVTVDIDTVEEDLPKWLRFFVDAGGDLSRLTVSSDASIPSPRNLYEQVRSCVVEHGFPIEQVLAIVTSNTARLLKLEGKGRLQEGKDADVLVLNRGSLEIDRVIAGGRMMVVNGEPIVTEQSLEASNRRIILRGKKHYLH